MSFKASLFDDVDVMLDDIEFENCAEGDVPADSDRLSCDFDEKDTCSWYHDYTASMLWETEGSSKNGEFTLSEFHWFSLSVLNNLKQPSH